MATREGTASDPNQYGQTHPIETPDLLERKQKEFQVELDKIPDKEKKSVILALEKSPELLNEKFKLMFLRTEVFDANVRTRPFFRKHECRTIPRHSSRAILLNFFWFFFFSQLAAQRYCRYWEKRVEIFGPTKAFQPLTLKDALCDDDVALGLGAFQLVPNRHDPMGRGILFIDPSKQQQQHNDKRTYTAESMARAVWYFINASLEQDETVQQHGMIFLAWPHHAKFAQYDRGLTKLVFGSIQGALPTRLSAIHFCQPPAWFHIVFPIMKLFMTDRTKKRIKAHYGSTAEIVAKLEPFGLSKDDLPEQLGGTIQLDVVKWLEQRRAAGL
jgi:hypothetical protein